MVMDTAKKVSSRHMRIGVLRPVPGYLVALALQLPAMTAAPRPSAWISHPSVNFLPSFSGMDLASSSRCRIRQKCATRGCRIPGTLFRCSQVEPLDI